jgi:hypothetical protein
MSIATATMDESDIMAGTDVSSGIDKKFTLGNLADYFLETHELSLNGTNQTVKHAIDDIGDVGEIREAVEEEAEAREAADTTLNEIKADKTQVDALAEAKADQTDVDELEGRVDTLAAMFAGTSVETVLFEGSAIGAGTIINLSDSITSYDFLDIYAYKHGTTDIRTIPATTSAEYYLRFTNISNNPSSDKGVQINEMLIQTTSETTVTIANEVTWEWSGVSTANARASVVTPSDAGTELARILKIVGRKLVGNTELADLRVGYDGTTYASAGAAVRGQIGELHTEIGDLSDLETEDQTNLVAAINEAASSGGGGLTEAIKTALLQLASKVAYIDANGQTYYNALYNALYPPAELVSIAAVYTQSGTVYTTDTLDSLKTDLVVTATYDDLSTRTVPAEDYTLTGTLAVGTSTITVLYGGQTATFTVVVTESALYPLDDVAEVRAGSDVWVAISNGNHIYGRTASNSRGPYIFKDGHVSINATTAFGVMFAVPAGATFTLNVKNFRYTGNTDTSNLITINCRNEIGTGTTSIVGGECRYDLTTTGDGTKNDFTGTFTVESAQNVYGILAWVYRAVEFEFDIELYVNGQRYV